MKINAKKLTEVYPEGSVPRIAPDERYYLIPGASDYAMSDYGRVYNFRQNRHERMKWDKFMGECYTVRFDNSKSKKGQKVSIHRLLSLTFFGGIKCRFGHGKDLGKYRWKVTDLHILRNQKQIIEYIQAKIEHRKPRYPKSQQGNVFVNRMQLTRTGANLMYQNAKGRATRASVKRMKPHYQDTTMETELIKNPQAFYKWLLKKQYYHPLGLELDKDILTFGLGNHYSRKTMCLVPRYINDFFRETKCELGYSITQKTKDGKTLYCLKDADKNKLEYTSYMDALLKGRQVKAEKIRRMVAYETEQGYMPKYILNKMSEWADKCETGEIQIWEPSPEIIKEKTK